MNERDIIIRQAILQALKSYRRAPASCATILTSISAMSCEAQMQELVDQAAVLLAAGYVENLKPGRNLLLRITEKGLRQIELSGKLDEMIWGDRALQL